VLLGGARHTTHPSPVRSKRRNAGPAKPEETPAPAAPEPALPVAAVPEVVKAVSPAPVPVVAPPPPTETAPAVVAPVEAKVEVETEPAADGKFFLLIMMI